MVDLSCIANCDEQRAQYFVHEANQSALRARTSSSSSRKCDTLQRMMTVSSEYCLNVPRNNAVPTTSREANQRHNRVIRPAYNRAESAADFLDANDCDFELQQQQQQQRDAGFQHSGYTEPSPSTSLSPSPSPLSLSPSPSVSPSPSRVRIAASPRSQSMRIAEDANPSVPATTEPPPTPSRGRARKQSTQNVDPHRISTLEVPDRLALTTSSGLYGAYSTPPSPHAVRPQAAVRKTSINYVASYQPDWDDAVYHPSSSQHHSQAPLRTDSQSRSPSRASSRDLSPRAHDSRSPAAGRRLPCIPTAAVAAIAVAHTKSSDTLADGDHEAGVTDRTAMRRRFLRPQPCSDVVDTDAYFDSNNHHQVAHSHSHVPARLHADRDTFRQRRADTSVDADRSRDPFADSATDGDWLSNRSRSGSDNNNQTSARTSFRRSETARVSDQNASPSLSPSPTPSPMASRGSTAARDAQRLAEGAARRTQPPRKISIGSQPTAANSSETDKRHRAFSTVVNEANPKSSRSDSLSSTRSTNGSNSTLSDVSSLQYIELYRAMKDREQVLEEIRQSFKMFDKDGDGTVSKDEIASVMRQLGLNSTDEEIQKMISEVDEDGNGCLDFGEFSKMMLARFGEIEQQDKTLQRVFRVFDKDGDGFIDAKELKRVMGGFGEALSDDEINEMINTADTDGDGKVSYEEFARTLSSIGINGRGKLSG